MQTYDGWADKDKTDFKKWIVDVFAAKNIEFMKGHGGQCSDHYWSNWDLVNMCSYMAIGILTENDDMVNYVVNYFYNGVGNGYIGKLIQEHLQILWVAVKRLLRIRKVVVTRDML